MKKYISAFLSAVALLSLGSCDDKLDIVPKGASTLETTEDLELLLNHSPQLPPGISGSMGMAMYETAFLTNDYFPFYTPYTTLFNNPNSINYAIATYDENVNRADLVTSDQQYSALHSKIYVSNVLISKIPTSSGLESKKPQIIAEAKVRRAWYEFLLVNRFAKQYDPATAETDGGVAYVTDTDMGTTKEKLTVAQVYEKILEDCSDEVLADLAQQHSDTPLRFGVDFGYGVRARVLFQMKRYDEAMEYVNKALAVNSILEDRSEIKQTLTWSYNEFNPNNYYCITCSAMTDFSMLNLTPSLIACFSPDDYIIKYAAGDYGPGYPALDDADPYFSMPEGVKMLSVPNIFFNVWGLRTETMKYMAAEYYIKQGDFAKGLKELDDVQKLRIENYEPLAPKASSMSKQEVIAEFKKAKRVEFFHSFDRYFDLKRWNSEGADWEETLVRDYGDGQYRLTPDSKLWIHPFPQDATNVNPTMTQNY